MGRFSIPLKSVLLNANLTTYRYNKPKKFLVYKGNLEFKKIIHLIFECKKNALGNTWHTTYGPMKKGGSHALL
jgi:hypothetical protein